MKIVRNSAQCAKASAFFFPLNAVFTFTWIVKVFGSFLSQHGQQQQQQHHQQVHRGSQEDKEKEEKEKDAERDDEKNEADEKEDAIK